MDGKEEVLVGGGTEYVGNDPVFEGEERSFAQVPGEEYLEADDAHDDIFGQWLGTTELGDLPKRLETQFWMHIRDVMQLYLRVSLDDGQPTSAMGFLGVSPEEVLLGTGGVLGLGLLGGASPSLGRGIGDCL